MRARRLALRAGLALTCVGLLACEREVSIGRIVDAAIVPVDGSSPIDPVFSCAQRGPLFDLSDGVQGACGDGSRGFHYALCSCSDVVSGTLISSDGFDSRQAAYAPGAASGALGAVGAFYPHKAELGGSLIVASADGIPLGDDLAVGGNLFDQGQLQGAHSVTVKGNAQIAGDARLTELTVGGSCTLAPGSALEAASGIPPVVVRDEISVAPPCSCDRALDLAGVIAAASQNNDNAALALDPETWLKVLDTPLERSLPCGRYYSSNLNAARAITLHIEGRVALYVQSGAVVENTGALTIDLAQGAEFDLFVENGISAAGPVSIGDVQTPTRTRLHFGGPDTLFFSGTTTLATSLYGPASELVSTGSFELYGAALVRRISADQTVTLHYDRALARDACSAASCASDGDCAATLRCDHGSCLP